MLNRWYRIGDFYEHHNSDADWLKHKTTFRNINSSVLKEIKILHYRNGETSITFTPSYRNQNKLLDIFVKYFTWNGIGGVTRGWGEIEICISPDNYVEKSNRMQQLVSYINKEYSNQEISKELINELAQLFDWLYVKNKDTSKKPQHRMGNSSTASAHINPLRKTSFALINFLSQCKRNEPYNKKFDSLLILGEDPNQCNVDGETPLLSCLHLHIEYLKRLLIMGANCLHRPQGDVFYFRDPLELAEYEFYSGYASEKKDRAEKIHIMLSHHTKLEKQPFRQVIKTNMTTTLKNEIICLFHFKEGPPIQTQLKKTSALTYSEIEDLFNVFSKHFVGLKKTSNNPKIFAEICLDELKELFFHKYLLSKNKFIDLIICEKKIIGFNLFQILNLTQHPDYLFLHCDVAGIDSAFRYGIMSFLSFRLAHCLQQLVDNKKVGIFICSNHFNSFRMLLPKDVTDEAYCNSVMEQPEHIIEIRNELTKKVYGEDAILYHDQFTCFVEENNPLKVKGSYLTKSPDIYEEFFYKTVQSHNADFSDGPRDTPVLFLVEDRSRNRLKKQCANLGIAFEDHIDQLAPLFLPFCQQYSSTRRSNNKNIYKGNFLFWLNEAIPTTKNDNQYTEQVRSRL